MRLCNVRGNLETIGLLSSGMKNNAKMKWKYFNFFGFTFMFIKYLPHVLAETRLGPYSHFQASTILLLP